MVAGVSSPMLFHRPLVAIAAVSVLLLLGDPGYSGQLPQSPLADRLTRTTPQETVTALRRLAEQGDATAQFKLGVIYDIGAGVPQDDGQAAMWYRMAAEQGIAAAQRNLASMYANGRGVSRDYRQAASWCRKAAQQGSAFRAAARWCSARPTAPTPRRDRTGTRATRPAPPCRSRRRGEPS